MSRYLFFCECDFNYIVFECLCVLILSSIVDDRDSIVDKKRTQDVSIFPETMTITHSYYYSTHSKSQ